MPPRACPYCADARATLVHADARHPVWTTMPAVNLFECSACRSHYTHPLPDPQVLAQCYSRYAVHGYPAAKARAKTLSRQHEWYRFVHRHCRFDSKPRLRVADIGAGEAYLLRETARLYPDAALAAFDFGAPPDDPAFAALLASRLRWRRCDLDDADFGPMAAFDVVYCIAVIEHVRHPDRLLARLMDLTAPGGRLFVFGPRARSLAQIAMGRKWIYHIPGEHLSIPSFAGLRRCLARLRIESYTLAPICQRYSTRYIATALWPQLTWAPDFLVPLPTGCFLLSIRKPA